MSSARSSMCSAAASFTSTIAELDGEKIIVNYAEFLEKHNLVSQSEDEQVDASASKKRRPLMKPENCHCQYPCYTSTVCRSEQVFTPLSPPPWHYKNYKNTQAA
ncbi:hypothetical protein AMATHDRAFT_7478 [Amanita thiersii Skay4041]|uniref:Uncharacterized protein n=1 Tax=Amanita thiersii Skay4041 TaxID=703135 RepID=A0A2A9N8J9_9AGAR|nr:hypothetical protein AMATHDRAFT_7478 [Amanita thiersii Skay4041]